MTEGDRRLLERIEERAREAGKSEKTRKRRLRKPLFEEVMVTIIIINMAISTICWILVILKKSGLM